MATTMMTERGSFTFTVGKLDAGMAILIGSRAHLIEFPSILLPDGVGIGSIVSIDVHRNINEEEQQKATFWKLQNDIYTMYGIHTPAAPILKLRHVTQTSVTLEWPSLQLATATLRSLDIYRNNQRLASIPNPTTNTSTKLSSLQISTEYTFQLVLRTTAGTFPSNVIKVKTHTIEDTSGISVCFGTILDNYMGDGESASGRKEELINALESMGAKWSEKIQIDTTHFVCTTSLSLAAVSSSSAGGPKTMGEEPGVEYQKAMQLSIPIVQPDWVLACYYGKKMVPTAPYYLGASIPPLVQGHNRVQSISQRGASQSHVPLPPSTPTTSTSPAAKTTTPPTRQSSAAPPPFNPGGKSLPRNPSSSPGSTPGGVPTPFVPDGSAPNSADPTVPVLSTSTTSLKTETPDEEDDDEDSPTTPSGRRASAASRARTGTMNKAFKFPPTSPVKSPGNKSPGLTISPPPPVPPVPPIIVVHEAKDSVDMRHAADKVKGRAIEPPTPDLETGGPVPGLEKEDGDGEDEIVEVDLS